MNKRMNGDKPSNYFRVWNGLLEPKHRELMGSAVWLFLYFIDHTTKERPNKHDENQTEGWVYGKTPITLKRISKETGMPERTVSRHLLTLEMHDYIHTIRAPHGLIVLVQKSCKWESVGNMRNAKNGVSRSATNGESPAKNGVSGAKNGVCRKDNTVDNTRDNTEGRQNTALCAVSLPPPDSNSESQRQPQEKSNPNPCAIVDTRAPLHSLAREKLAPKGKSQADLDEARRKLLLQAEEIKRKYPSKDRPGNVVEMHPQEAIA